MKKLLAILLCLTLSLAVFAGCGGGSDDGGDSSDTTVNDNPGTDDAGDGDGDANQPDGDGLRVALLLSGNLGDMSFLDSSNEGMNQVAAKYGADVRVIEMGADSTRYETNVLDASEDGYDVIIGSGWQLQEPFENVANDFPDTRYIIFDAEVNYAAGGYENVYSINYKQNEGSFLAGVLAASMSETGTLGFLGGMDGAVINDFLLGYIEGAQHINPDIKVLTAYVGSYDDSARCKEMALAMYNQGADFVFTAAGAAGLGTLEAAQEEGKWAIGVDSDQAMLFHETDPDKASHIPTSVMKRVDNSLVRAFDMIDAGTLPWGTAETLGLEEGAVGLAENSYYTELVSQELRNEIAAISGQIVSGDIVVTTAFGMEPGDLTAIIESVSP